MVYISPPPLYKRKIIWIFILILILIPLGSYGYKIYFLKTPAPPASTHTSPTTSLTLKCPFLDKKYCDSGTITKFKGESALSYKVASGSSILSSTNIEKGQDIDFFENPLLNAKTIKTAANINNSCYKVTYLIPKDSKFYTPSLPLKPPAEVIATIGQEILEGVEANLILTVKKITDPQKPCTIKGNPEDGISYPIEQIEIL